MNCIFCQIIQRQIPSNVVFETDHVLCIEDIAHEAPFHVLIMPKQHVISLNALHHLSHETILAWTTALSEVPQNNGWSSYRVIVNTGASYGQSVFHLHAHILAGSHE
jgi:histidine triad (HIT) family protein